jgi:hypothetical protein
MNWNYDDAAGERNLDVDIDYIYYPGYWEGGGRDEPPRYFISGMFEIEAVHVECVEYYNPEGRIITTVKRNDMQEDAVNELDAEAFDYICSEVEWRGALADELVENAG